MKFPEPIAVTTIAEWIGAEIIGNSTLMLTGINEIHKVEHGDITFSDAPKYFKKSLESAASAIILSEAADCPNGKAILVCKEAFMAYDSLISKYRPFSPIGNHVPASSTIGEGTHIEPGVRIGKHVQIGKDCYIQSGVYIGDYTQIGDRVEIQANAAIGTDAFYFKKYPEFYQKWTTGGHVIIENDVRIGANCTINSGVSGTTVIGENSKLDCLVHIGHGVVLGKRVLLAGQVGIGGKTIVGDDVVMYGQVGVAQNLVIGAGAIISAKSGVSKNLAGGKAYFGIPAEEIRLKQRQLAALRNLAKGNK